jgi:hypothetical protein
MLFLNELSFAKEMDEKDELKSFLKKQLNSSNEITGLDQGYSFGSSF